MSSTLILIDGRNALYRFGFAHATLSNTEGEPTGAIFGVLRSLIQLKRRYPEAQFVVVWDGKGASWRHRLFPDYKANRRKVVLTETKTGQIQTTKPNKANVAGPQEDVSYRARAANKALAKDLVRDAKERVKGGPPLGLPEPTGNRAKPLHYLGTTFNGSGLIDYKDEEHDDAVRRVLCQEKPLRKLLSMMQIPQLEVETVEADDLIGMAAILHRTFNLPVVVYSSDKDFMQLMQAGVTIIRPQPFAKGRKDKLAPETAASVLAKFGCAPEQILKIRAFAGDKSDNIPVAIPGIGEKRALACLQGGADPSQDKVTCKDLKMQGRLRASWQAVRRNYRLMQIAAFPDPALLGAETVREIKEQMAGAAKHMLTCAAYPRVLDIVTAGGVFDFHREYRRFVRLLVSFDLLEAIEQRHFLWRIQRVQK